MRAAPPIACLILLLGIGADESVAVAQTGDSRSPGDATALVRADRASTRPASLLADASDPAKQQTYTDITPADACSSRVAGGHVVFLDVREPSEYLRGDIPGALHMPWLSGVLQARHNELPTGENLIVYCQSGGRSRSAAQFLVDNGHEGVYNMLGGYSAWVPCPTSARRWHLYR